MYARAHKERSNNVLLFFFSLHLNIEQSECTYTAQFVRTYAAINSDRAYCEHRRRIYA